MDPARLVAGIDLGSTGLKMLVTDEAGLEIGSAQVATPWRSGPGGTTEMDASVLLAAVRTLVTTAARRVAEVTDAPIEAVALAGMGETGMLVDAHGVPVAPAYAWFDPRGAEQAAAFPARIRADFAGRTGLPLGAQVSVAKLAYLRDQGVRLEATRWLNLPEFVAAALGGEPVSEYSLASRTGLLDQDTGLPWTDMLHVLGVTDAFLPRLVHAGTPIGVTGVIGGESALHGGNAFGGANGLHGGNAFGGAGVFGGTGEAGDVPENLRGALLTIAGHDHLVAAEATGGLPASHYHVSMGTAEVLLRVIDAPLGFEARGRLAEYLINEVRHVVPGKHVLVAGVKTGLLLRRVLQTAGIHDRAGRDRLDAAAMDIPYAGTLPPDAIEVSGARNDDGVLKLTVRTDGVSPAEVFGAVLRHSNDEIRLLIDAMDAELPPATTSTLTGGWTGMAAVRRAREQVLPAMTASTREQETAYGATRAAARLLSTIPPKIGTAP
ncbi:FGGY-family carbohydrate kinase [Paractinoplanes ovalisporus]|uniref:FGGY-family carbohydrate kinase n=1 Tax=Paractinoplanes ovalisporus TaxID=2810368 RepID=UPI001EFF2549|nr:FGGY family carbohydrate kinase [Actinoplanes ovalisporus]